MEFKANSFTDRTNGFSQSYLKTDNLYIDNDFCPCDETVEQNKWNASSDGFISFSTGEETQSKYLDA